MRGTCCCLRRGNLTSMSYLQPGGAAAALKHRGFAHPCRTAAAVVRHLGCRYEVLKFIALYFIVNVGFTLAFYSCVKGNTAAIMGVNNEGRVRAAMQLVEN